MFAVAYATYVHTANATFNWNLIILQIVLWRECPPIWKKYLRLSASAQIDRDDNINNEKNDKKIRIHQSIYGFKFLSGNKKCA